MTDEIIWDGSERNRNYTKKLDKFVCTAGVTMQYYHFNVEDLCVIDWVISQKRIMNEILLPSLNNMTIFANFKINYN